MGEERSLAEVIRPRVLIVDDDPLNRSLLLLVRDQVRQLAELQALKDDLVSMMVHDMRNPLTGLLATLAMLAEELPKDPVQAQQDAVEALDLAHRLRTLLDEVLQVRMLEEG